MNLICLTHQKSLSLFIGITAIALLIPISTIAQHNHIFKTKNDLNADITKRLSHHEAEFAMTTQEGSVDLMVTDHAIIIQFSDQFLDELADEIRDEGEHDEASVFADVFLSMISSGVHSLLNRALLIPLHDIQEVYYSNGKLYIIDKKGEEIFSDLDINDIYIMEDFSRRDARRFVAAAEKRML